ncbi:hypothetical protein HK102_011102 [Quaeritorhiza haematococci]|nr:hypothetical protein HK102_011102 [Quaeritorhiza haematococci]
MMTAHPSGILLVAESYPQDLESALAEIVRNCPHQNFVTSETMADHDGIKFHISFAQDEELTDGQYTVSTSHQNYKDLDLEDKFEVRITYKRKIEAFRGLGRAFGAVCAVDSSGDVGDLLNIRQEAQFDTLGLLRYCALLGLNTFQLYTEDTYEISGEPFFGYMRGGFTQEELSAIDSYANDFGIEVIPCIQTLGHLGQILQWPRFASIRDTHEVLLANSEETYAFLDKMIDSATKPFRSKRIHIGMDEAHGIGEGRFRQIFGSKEGTEVFMEHLRRVHQICRAHELQPMIWSDMLFTLASKNNTLQGYYDNDNHIPAEVSNRMPSDIDLVYWDYYHTHMDVYSRKIRQHRELGHEPWVAGGIWTWNRFFTALPFTLEASKACLMACKADNVRNVFVTTWGDDGNECDIISALPGLLYYGEHGYTPDEDIDPKVLKRQFAGICGGNFDDWVFASKIDIVPSFENIPIDTKTHFPPNPSKWLLWQDPFYNMFTPQCQGYDLALYYAEIAQQITKASQTALDLYPLNARLKFPALIATALSIKADLRRQLMEAYHNNVPPSSSSSPTGVLNINNININGSPTTASPHSLSAAGSATSSPTRPSQSSKNKSAILALCEGPLSNLRETLSQLWRYHRDEIWLTTYKPFGLEILELRYGGVRTRLDSLHDRLLDYFHGLRERVEELEAGSQVVYEGAGMSLVLDFARTWTPARALGTG